MNHGDLVDAYATKAGVTKAAAKEAVEAVFGVVADALKGGDEVRVNNFGAFSVKTRAAGKGRNLRTGEVIDVAASKSVGFKNGKALKDALAA